MELTLSPVSESPDSLILSKDMLLKVDELGEVIGIQSAPDNAAQIEEIIDFIGPRRLAIQSEIDALKAKKAAYIAAIDAMFDPLIKTQESALSWLTERYKPALEAYAREVIPTLKKKSFRAGLLLLSLRKDSASTDVVKKDTALIWAKANCPEAIKTTETVQVSQIPDAVKETLTPDRLDETGIVFYPAGEDKFEVK